MFFGFFLHYIVNTRAKTSVVQSLAVGKLTSGFPNRVLNMSLFHMKITEVSKSWPSGDTLYSVVMLTLTTKEQFIQKKWLKCLRSQSEKIDLTYIPNLTNLCHQKKDKIGRLQKRMW